MHLRSHDHIWSPTPRKNHIGCFANLYFKMFEILLMCSTMTIQTIQRIMFTVSAEQDELERTVQQSHSSPPTMPNKLVTWSMFCKSPSRVSTLVLQRWHATVVVEVVVAAVTVVVEVIGEEVEVVVASLLPTLHLSAAVDGDLVRSWRSKERVRYGRPEPFLSPCTFLSRTCSVPRDINLTSCATASWGSRRQGTIGDRQIVFF